MKSNELKNGLELILSLALSLDLLEQYNPKGVLKKKVNNLKNDIYADIVTRYNEIFNHSEEFVQNSLRHKENMIKIFAKYNEADCILACDMLKKFDDNIEEERKKGIVVFETLNKD
tara:strand:- start:66 stop:413 length:348 start_codon:yes stop_codon:yes gene_type:complete